ncbi:MAG: FecR family protein [Ginsengibacter sp.]
MLDREKFLTLLDKYTLDKISPAERTQLFAWITSGDFDDVLLQHIERNLRKNVEGANLPPHRSAGILYKILSSEKQNSLLIPKNSSKLKIVRWVVAAAFAGAIAFSAYYLTVPGNKNTTANVEFRTGLLMKENTSAQPLKIEMEEGSIVTLQPGSVIHYPTHFLPEKREIYLDGEAYFEVSKNPGRPFFVYDRNIVTHVIGTSFNIKMNKETQQLEIFVRSGKVEVYENKPATKTTGGKKNNGVILLPNQKVIYDQATRQFLPSLVDDPLPIIDETVSNHAHFENFVFEGAILKTVFQSLEKAYGIEIVVENDNIYKCLFTGDVSSQDLYTKLDIICKSIQASYEVKETKILVKGTGCN